MRVTVPHEWNPTRKDSFRGVNISNRDFKAKRKSKIDSKDLEKLNEYQKEENANADGEKKLDSWKQNSARQKKAQNCFKKAFCCITRKQTEKKKNYLSEKDNKVRKYESGSKSLLLKEEKLIEPKMLPPKDSKNKYKKTLVIDIEGTQIYSIATDLKTLDSKKHFYDFTIEILNSDDIKLGQGVNLRPSLSYFLEEAAKICEIIFWTAGKKSIYQKMLDIIDPKNLASHRLFKEYCKHTEFGWQKNFNQLNRDPGTVILIECYSISRDVYPYNIIELQ